MLHGQCEEEMIQHYTCLLDRVGYNVDCDHAPGVNATTTTLHHPYIQALALSVTTERRAY